MATSRKTNVKAYARAIVAILLMTFWTLALITGWLLWFAPHGPRSGRIPLLLGLTKPQWGDVHFWFSMIATAVTIAHIAIDWKALRGCVRYLTSAHRPASGTIGAADRGASEHAKPSRHRS